MESDKLTFSLLGPPLITFRGKAIQVKRRKVRYLSYYLACQEFPVSRANLCDVFWPECSELEARKNLREALSNLRSSLNMGDYLIIHGDFISLDSEKIAVDVRDFENVVQMMRKNLEITSGGSLFDPIYLKVREGVQLWRTPGFLAGASLEGSSAFQKWAIETNQDLEYWRQLMLEWLADHCITLGNLTEALQWLSMALLNDRQNTELNLLLLNCLKDLGAWSELRHFCEMLESVYQENGESVMPQLLAESIQRARELARQPFEQIHLVWENNDKNKIHYVDEEHRISLLKKRFQNGGMTLLRGEAGSGKSRLLWEFYQSLEVIPRLFYHRARPVERTIPYQVLVDGFTQIVSEEEWRNLDSIYAKTLFPLFPFLIKVRSDIKERDLEFSIGLNRLIPEAFLALFKLISSRCKCLLILDDAQWCDAETLRILSYVHERGGPEEIGSAILSTRVEINNPALEKVFSQNINNRFMDILDIPLLSDSEISMLTSLVYGEKLSVTVNKWLAEESGKNPYLLIEILNSVIEENSQTKTQVVAENYSLNQNMREIVQARLNDLDEKERKVLFAAAVIGRQFRLSPLEFMVNRSPIELSEIIKKFKKCTLSNPSERTRAAMSMNSPTVLIKRLGTARFPLKKGGTCILMQ